MDYLLAALLGGFFLFNSAATPKRAARMAEKSLRKQYPGADINVEITGKRGAAVLKGNFRRVRVQMAHLSLAGLPFETAREGVKAGHAQNLEIDLSDVSIGNLPVSRAKLDFEGVAYDFGALKKQAQFRLVRLGSGKMQLQLSAAALLPAFAAKLKDTQNVTLTTSGQTLTLRGNRTVLGNVTPIEVSGVLAGRGSELRLETPSLLIGGSRVPDATAGALLRDLNPLYDFDKGLQWPFRTEITSASGEGNQIDLKANLKLKTPGS